MSTCWTDAEIVAEIAAGRDISAAQALQIIAAEREACAKIVEDEGECRHVDHAQGFCACADKAAAIRARSNQST